LELIHVEEREKVNRITDQLIVITDPASTAAEAYRTLRTNLLHGVMEKSPKVVLLTSPGPGEGKTTTCANLGIALAQADKSTLILDCHLRQPSLHTFFRLPNMRGLTDVLAGVQRPQALWEEPLPGLKVLTAGPMPPSPPELFETKRFTEFLEGMRQEFDYVLVDAPPVDRISDSLILATRADGVLLILDAQLTRKSSLRRTIRDLEAINVRIIGTVMNNVDASREG
jgi:capsular exopolysaccharide synthesis family protein